MEHLSLYRKWRPQTFSEVVGQGRVTNTLANAFASGRLVHAYLFSGPRGTGKTSTARILAKAINCEEGPTATPCNSCEACVSISEGTALDVIEIDAASNRKIDEIRDLLDKIPYTPTALRTKVYIIDEVHQLTTEASSALLKTLEEPPGHVVFVLATTEPHKLLPTIVSRCQKFDFSLVSAQDMAELLTHVAKREEIDIDSDAIAMVAEHARGSVRDAIGVMDQISNLSGERITPDELADLLGEVETSLVFEVVDMIVERDTPGALMAVGRLVDDGKDPRRFVEALISHLRALFLVQNSANPQEIVGATEEHYARIAEQARLMRRHEVIRLMERLGDAHREMRWSENPRLILECALVKITSLDADATLEGLAFRLDELERKLDALAGGEAPVPGTGAARTPGPRKRPAKPVPVESAVDSGATPTPPVPPAAVEPARAPEPAEEQGAKGTPAEREKSRRAWMAVLAEIKNSGQMKLWTLLGRARVVSCAGGELVLGFGDDATFQMEALQEGDLARIAEVWERFVGENVKVSLVPMATGRQVRPQPAGGARGAAKARGGAARPKGAPDAEAPPGTARPEAASKPGATGVVEEKPVEAPGADGGDGDGDDEPGRRSPAQIAKMFKDSFDGEIIEENREGKD